MAIVEKPLTLEQFLALPEEKPALEFAEGVVQQKVSPKGKHSAIQTGLVERLNQIGRRGKVARAFTELRTTFANASLVPDISVFRWDRIPVDELGEITNDFREPPDIAVEIVSPEQSVNALIRRCLWYVEHGVPIALLVDPKDKSVLIFRRNRIPAPRASGDSIDLSDVLPDFQLTVQELFDSLRMD
jgi:Uma2 family endonuclease